MNTMLQYLPVTTENWTDLEQLFESRGGPSACWCMVWRNLYPGQSRQSKSDKKNALHDYVHRGLPVGLLCYAGTEPVAWCSIAPHETYRPLSGVDGLENVWSLVCFFIHRKYRKQGLTETLVTEALRYAREQGARYVEAYPVDPDSPSYRFMGYKPLFDKLGFTFHHKAGTRRNVMLVEV